MLNRIKRLYKLSKKDPEALEQLTDAQINAIPNAGDGKAIFFSQGSEQEYQDLQDEESGMKKWYERLKNL